MVRHGHGEMMDGTDTQVKKCYQVRHSFVRAARLMTRRSFFAAKKKDLENTRAFDLSIHLSVFLLPTLRSNPVHLLVQSIIIMVYGVSNLDLGKIVVLLSCIFNVFMTAWIAKDPVGVIASPQGGGWWDVLQEVPFDSRTHIYPRMFASSLIMILVVRVNWCLTVETSPSLYRCVLISYLLPFIQYVLECQYFKTMPPFDTTMAAMMIVPWFTIIVGYPKYTKEPSHATDDSRKQD